jgi:class 3 adenylate cyclase
MQAVNEGLLDERLALLEKARPWSARLVSKLESHLRNAPDEALFRINPFTFAREKNAAEAEVVDLFLYAAAQGLFGMDWLLVCPGCSCVVESFRSLKSVHNHYHCSFCQATHEAALDEYIAVTFTVNPEIRDIAFHHPEQLSARDYVFKVCNTADGVLPDGKPFVQAKAESAAAVCYVAAGETTRVEVELAAGTVLAASPEGSASVHFAVAGPSAGAAQVKPVRFGAKEPPRKDALAPGKVALEVHNSLGERGTLVVAPIPSDMPKLRFVPFLTGKRLLTTQAFRDLFRTEVIRASEGISVREITFLFTDLKGSTALYDRIGDLNAFSLVQQHFEALHDVTVRHGGAIIKTIGDAVMATFLKPADAVAAALEMRAAISASNRGRADRELVLKVGVHAGAAIAVTLNERLDYFGQTVNIAARVQGLAEADEIYLSEDTHAADGVVALLASHPVDSKVLKLKGVQQDMRVFCVAAPASKAAARA